MRVHELAKEFDISSSKLIEEIKGYGITVKSHLSGLLDDEVDDIRNKHSIAQVVIQLENELQERKKEEDTSSLVLEDLSDDLPEDVEEEPKTEEFNGVEVDEQLNPVDEMEDVVERPVEIDASFIENKSETTEQDDKIEVTEEEKQKEMISAEKETEDATEAWSSMKELARQDDDAEWTKKVLEADAKIAVQKVIVEKPKGFWSWLKSIFDWLL
jgi:translation initiation factor IF-2